MEDTIFNTCKPIVMFFGLINSLAIFQTMMNDFLKNIIEIGDIAVFIDDMIVEMKTKEEHDDIVENILRRIVENYLFIYKTREKNNRRICTEI